MSVPFVDQFRVEEDDNEAQERLPVRGAGSRWSGPELSIQSMVESGSFPSEFYNNPPTSASCYRERHQYICLNLDSTVPGVAAFRRNIRRITQTPNLALAFKRPPKNGCNVQTQSTRRNGVNPQRFRFEY